MPGKIIDIGNGQRIQLPEIKWRLVGLVVVALIVVIGAISTGYTVEANERGVVTRFGAYSKTVDPGFHLKLPFGIDRVYKVKTAFTFKEEFGFRTRRGGVRTEYERPMRGSRMDRIFDRESSMVTGDLNMAKVEWIVQFNIEKDPRNYLFRLRNPEATLRDVSESIMREVVGDMTVTEVLTDKRTEINSEVKRRLQKVLKEYQAGIKITQVSLQDVGPPSPVKAAFDDVNNAQQEKEKTINEARQAYNKVIPLAKGDALKMIQEAEGYALDRVNRAEGEVARFKAILVEYLKAPEVTMRRLYLETMKQVLPSLDRKIILDHDAKGVLPLLDLGKGRR